METVSKLVLGLVCLAREPDHPRTFVNWVKDLISVIVSPIPSRRRNATLALLDKQSFTTLIEDAGIDFSHFIVRFWAI